MRNVNCSILNGSDATPVVGDKLDTNQLVSASFMAVFGDATANGLFSVQVSNDPYTAGYLPQDFTPVNWITVQSNTVSLGASSLISIPQMCYRWARAIYTPTSGGSSTVVVNMNGLSI